MASKKKVPKDETPETWTVMVYLAGDNNLSTESIYALTEMKRAKPNALINVIVQFDPKDDFLPTCRYKITSNKVPDEQTQGKLATGERNSGELTSSDQASGELVNDMLDKAPFQESDFALLRDKRRADTLKRLKRAITTPMPSEINGPKAKKDLAKKIAFKKGFAIRNALDRSIEFELLGNAEPSIGSETDTGSPVTLFNFLSFCLHECPAEHYMVIPSGHGAGTETDYLLRDDSSRGSLTIAGLKQALVDFRAERGGKKTIDILGMDSCLMSMAEVCYELKGLVDIVVGCESYSPASGWPYREAIERLGKEAADKTNTELVKERVAKGMVEEYVNFYADYWLGGLSVTQSALNVSKVTELKRFIDSLATALIEGLNNPQIEPQLSTALVLAHWEAQSYNGEQFVDLADFCHCLSDRYPVADITKPSDDLADFIINNFVLKSCYSGPIYQYSHGVSIYFPWANITDNYSRLDFNAGEGNWADFLKTYIEKTRRSPRGIKNKPEFEVFNFPPSQTREAGLILHQIRQTDDKGAKSLVRSMRNPPIFALPDECINANTRASIIANFQKRLEELESSQVANQQKRKKS